MTVVLLAGCGGGGGDDDVTAAEPTGATDASAASSTFEACLADQGVEVPEGVGQGGAPSPGASRPSGDGPGPGGAMSDEMRAAFEACGDLAPGGLGAGGDSEAFEEYRDCLADHGVELPDPASGDGPPSSVDEDNPAFEAADEACGDLRPERPTGSTSPTEDTP